MRPHIDLDLDVLRANVRVWREHTQRSVHAVVKADGYGWGFSRVVGALEECVERFYVADVDEFFAVRAVTQHAIAILATPDADAAVRAFDAGAIVNVETPEMLAVLARRANSTGTNARVRVGLRAAAGWSGVALDDIGALAQMAAAENMQVEVWTHVTAPDARDEQLGRLDVAQRAFAASGATVVGIDGAATATAATMPVGTAVRIGVGLFGSGGVPGLQCALSVQAPVVRTERHAAGMRVGYGGTLLSMSEAIVTARCGYGDGLPKEIAGSDDILSVGMQYVTALARKARGRELALLEPASDLDAFAARCGRLPHEVVTGFGNAARAAGAYQGD